MAKGNATKRTNNQSSKVFKYNAAHPRTCSAETWRAGVVLPFGSGTDRIHLNFFPRVGGEYLFYIYECITNVFQVCLTRRWFQRSVERSPKISIQGVGHFPMAQARFARREYAQSAQGVSVLGGGGLQAFSPGVGCDTFAWGGTRRNAHPRPLTPICHYTMRLHRGDNYELL
jgi:hypothetical protein